MLVKKFLPNSLADKVEDLLCSNRLPWQWSPGMTYDQELNNSNKDYQFVHSFISNNESTSIYSTFINTLADWFEHHSGYVVKKIHRIKANLLVKNEHSQFELDNLLHHDVNDNNYISMIYYVHDSDGDTLVFDNKINLINQISPKKNTAFWFRSKELHRPTPPVIYGARVIINCIFEVDED